MRIPLMQPTPPTGQEETVEKMLVAANEIMGFVPDPLLLMSVSPAILAEFTEFLGQYEAHPRLSSNLLAMMRYLVAAKNDCKYCVTTSEGIMIERGMDLDDLRGAQEDPSTVLLPEKEKALLLLVLKMVLNSDDVEAADLEIAYSNGWNDRDIYEAANYTVRNYAVDLLLKALKVDGQGAFA
ncbi:MAG: hypothetical protein KZQ91_19340 [Candidatus Thiodiazotropha sp. (ex Lucinoma borealis)]|nr:hypothetical protein [Candidatus Thiodiazotropha sp. (ex Lucinoma borealis)]